MVNNELLNRLTNFFLILEDRWIRGIELFNNQIDDYGDETIREKLKERDIINTPIHNIISLNKKYIFLLLDSIFMQRLRGIHHQGLAYLVYPTANHFRFEHSLGAYKLTYDIINSLVERKKEGSNYEKCEYTSAELLVAALLHDIGHYAFSHIGEHCFNNFIDNLPIDPRFKEIKRNKTQRHEPRTADIILGKDIFDELKTSYGLNQDLIKPFHKLFKIINKVYDDKDEKIKIENIAKLIAPKEFDENQIGTLINGPLDVDKLDYILRESYFTGTPFGNIDLHRIIKGYLIGSISKEGKNLENQLIFNKRMLPSILQMYMGRQFNYLTISYHKTVRIAETTLKIIIDIVMKEFFKKFKNNGDIEIWLKKIFFHFKLMEDRDFLHFIEIMVSLSLTAKNLYHKLITRTLYKVFIHKDSITLRESKYDQDCNRRMLLYLPINFLDLMKKDDLLFDFWNNLDKGIQNNFKEISRILQDFKEDVIILNTLNYPLSEEQLQTDLKEKLRDIYILDKGTSPIAVSILEDALGIQLSSFLKEIYKFNSKTILATAPSLTRSIKDSRIFKDSDFLEAFIHFMIKFNERD